MNTPKQRVAPRVDELAETAELPVLPDIAGSFGEDDQTVVLPSAIAESLPAPRAETAAADARGELEARLWGLTSSLRDLEEKLRAKGEQLAAFEREVGARDRRIAGLEQAAAQATDELREAQQARAALQARVDSLGYELHTATDAQQRQAAAHERLVRELAAVREARDHAQSRWQELRGRAENFGEALQSIEARRQIYEGMVGESELQLRQQQARIESLQGELRSRVQDGGVREQALQSHLAAESQRAVGLEGQLDAARAHIASLEQAAREHRAETEDQRKAAAANIHSLERQLEASTQDAAARAQALQASLDAAQQRAERLETELADAHARIASLEQAASEHGATVEPGRAALQARLDSALQAVASLEAEMQEHGESQRVLQEQLLLHRGRSEARGADLAAAEERIQTAEAELQQRDARIEKLLATEAELREQVERIDGSLERRNDLISRLESEAASSAAVLGDIQKNIDRLGQETVPGSKSSTASSGLQPILDDHVARLFVRTEGDTGIVHVLGRRTTIGRTPDNDLRLDEDFISRHHAVVLTSNVTTVIEDLDSTNGVYVNGSRVTRRVLQEGDVVTIGRTAFRFVLKPPSERAS